MQLNPMSLLPTSSRTFWFGVSLNLTLTDSILAFDQRGSFEVYREGKWYSILRQCIFDDIVAASPVRMFFLVESVSLGKVGDIDKHLFLRHKKECSSWVKEETRIYEEAENWPFSVDLSKIQAMKIAIYNPLLSSRYPIRMLQFTLYFR